jgi:hypothetical protein
MDLPDKRLKIQLEHTGQQLTDRQTQHGLDLDTLVPVIEAWDTTLSDYDRALSKEIERRETRFLKLEDAYLRTLGKQQTNAQAIQLPTFTRRVASLAKRRGNFVKAQTRCKNNKMLSGSSSTA